MPHMKSHLPLNSARLSLAGARRWWLWAHLAMGSAGVIVVSLCYILSPAPAVTPTLGQDLEAVRLVSLTDAGTMRLAGLGLGCAYLGAGHAREAVGFYWLALAALLYTMADALVGFAVIKPFFDTMLSGASLGYGLSAIFLGWPSKSAVIAMPRFVMRALLPTGLVVAVSGVACMLGAKAGLPLGAALTVLTTLYTALGLSQAWHSKHGESVRA
jgi:hypothetical protein